MALSGSIISTSSDVLAQSVEAKVAERSQSISALRSVSLPGGNPAGRFNANEALGALSNASLGSVNSQAITAVIPKAANMRTIANKAVDAAQALVDKAVYNTYRYVFDNIEALAAAGIYTYEIKLDTQQFNELSKLLTKNGYEIINLPDSSKYRISW